MRIQKSKGDAGKKKKSDAQRKIEERRHLSLDGGGIHVVNVGMKGRTAPGKTRMATVATFVGHGAGHEPAYVVARSIQDALDPTRAPGKVKSWAQMTPDERAKMQAEYAGRKRA